MVSNRRWSKSNTPGAQGQTRAQFCSQKDTGSGILIKIPMDAGYVTFSSLSDKFEMYCHMNVQIPKIKTPNDIT